MHQRGLSACLALALLAGPVSAQQPDHEQHHPGGGFLGWLRGERGHCSMVRVPTIAEEDAKRPNRERECLVKERTRLVNRMKGTLARLGIRNFRLTLRNAAEHLAALSTPEGSPLPPNVAAELERDIARLRLVIGQIKQIEEARRQRLEEQPERGPHAMVRLLARVVGIGIETADMLVNEGHRATPR